MPSSIDLKTTPTFLHVGYLKGIEYLGIGRYAHPSDTRTPAVQLCQLCGSLVLDKEVHLKWHYEAAEGLDESVGT